MDWNKSNTILIIAFLIVNIFLFSFVYFGDKFTQSADLEEKKEFLESVEEILKSKNITISCEIPSVIYEAPFLDIKYDIIYPNKELVESFIGEYNDKINDEILFYENGYESIEIVGRKKIIYISEEIPGAEIKNTESADNIINVFCKEKNVDIGEFSKINEVDTGEYTLVELIEKHKGYNLENAYMKFYIRGEKVIRFEMQKVISIDERAQIKSASAAEALLRLMPLGFVKNKEIVDMQICYYTSEDKDFESINSINVDLVWKVIFSDDSYVYLVGEDYL